VVVAALATGCGSSGGGAESTSAVVARVGDGDTLDLRDGRRVRLVQVDAPELGEGECYARAALAELGRLAPRGSAIELERDPTLDDVDRYGRLLRYATVDGTQLNVELVRRGAATPYFFHGERGRFADDLLTAVADARAARRGVWGSCRVSWRSDAALTTHPR